MARHYANFSAASLIAALGLCTVSVMVMSSPLGPGVQISPTSTQVVRYVNNSYIVTCTAENGDKVKWVSPEGKEVTSQTGRLHVEDRPQLMEGALALVFEHVTSTDKGNWTCQHETKDNMTKFFTMIINEPISFLDIVNTQNAREGSDATIRCIAKGDPAPTIYWYFNGGSINITSSKYRRDEKGLFISNITLSDKGRYTCKAIQVSTSNSDVKGEVIELNVQHKPIPVKKLPIHANAEPAFGYLHGTINLTCEATAEPAANFTWHRNNRIVSKKTGRIYEDTHVSMLQVEINDKNDLGDYICLAKNFMGTMKRVITLFEGHRPEIPTEMFLIKANHNNLEVKVPGMEPTPEPFTTSKPDNLPIIGYKFQIMKAPTILDNISVPKSSPELISNDVTELITSSSTEVPEEINEELWKNANEFDFKIQDANPAFVLTGLEPETNYTVRVMSRNPAGHSYPSRSFLFTTEKEVVVNGAKLSVPPPTLLTLIGCLSILIASVCQQTNLVKRKAFNYDYFKQYNQVSYARC